MSILASYIVPHPPMIIPAVGRGSEKQVAETIRSYDAVAAEIAELKPETIIITSPHAVMYADYFHVSPGRRAVGSFAQFGAPQVRFDETYDTELADLIGNIASGRDFPAGPLGERDKKLDHGTMVPLYFIRKAYTDFRLVRIGLSGLPLTDHYEFGGIIREAVERLDRRTVFVGSGDLSHKLQEYGPYGFAPEGPLYDARLMDVCSRAAFGELLDFDETFCDKAAECGHRSFVIMAGALDGLAVEAKTFSHEDVTGVGYGICSFVPSGHDAARHFLADHLARTEAELTAKTALEDPYVQLARRSIESYLLEGRQLPLPKRTAGGNAPAQSGDPALPGERFDRRAGVFVSLHKHDRLRGCIGTILPTTRCIAEEIIRNAISAATEDPRFDPVRPDEIKWLEISVDVLGDPEPVACPADLDVKRYGVIVTKGHRRGLLLPDLDGVDTVEEQISIAKRKAGIPDSAAVELQRFEVIRHH